MRKNWVQLSSILRSNAIGRMVRAGDRCGRVLYFLAGDYDRVCIRTETGPVVLSVKECQVRAAHEF